MRCQLYLFKLQIDRLVYPIDKLIDTSIDGGQNCRLLINLEFELCQQVLVKRILGRLDLTEQLHDLSLARVCSLILLLGLLDDLVGKLAIAAHELVGHGFELFFFGFELALHRLISILALHYELCQEESRINICFLQPFETIVGWSKLD